MTQNKQESIREQVLEGLKQGLERFEQKTPEEKLRVFQKLGILDEQGKVTPEYADTFIARESKPTP